MAHQSKSLTTLVLSMSFKIGFEIRNLILLFSNTFWITPHINYTWKPGMCIKYCTACQLYQFKIYRLAFPKQFWLSNRLPTYLCSSWIRGILTCVVVDVISLISRNEKKLLNCSFVFEYISHHRHAIHKYPLI